MKSVDIDLVALRKKYKEERDKRLRADANNQYIELTGEFAHYLDDPYAEPFERDPLFDEVEVLVMGAGFGGLLMGARLREAGIENIRLVERAGGVGGTWYWNRYPGAQCDVESYMYLPLLEELGYMPKERYSYADEIREHAERIAEHYNLSQNALFQTEVTELRWDEDAERWTVTTDRGDRFRARFVCSASGLLNMAKLPGIPGIKEFKGHTFHTSRWDYNYTGGSNTTPMEKIHDKRIGVIGTGATSLQIVPNLSRDAEQLFVFQRTPSTVGVRDNRPTDMEWAKSLQPGWQKQRRDNFDNVTMGGDDPEDLVKDGWTSLLHVMRDLYAQVEDVAAMTPAEHHDLRELANATLMERLRSRIDNVVEDKDTADALKAHYEFFCKRPGFHDDYLQSFNRPNTTLVDTQGKGVDRITENGLIVGGKEYELDCIIFATGFEVGTAYTRRARFEAYGGNGEKLSDHWDPAPRTLHSYATDKFPNLFFFSTVQAAAPFNIVSHLDHMATHIAHIIEHMTRQGIATVEAGPEACDKWVETVVSSSKPIWQKLFQACTPGYYSNEGDLENSNWPMLALQGPPRRFYTMLEKWRDEGSFAGLKLSSDKKKLKKISSNR